MFNRGSFVLRLIGVLLLIGLMIGGGVMAYRAGVAQGIAQAPAVAEALSNAAESGQALPVPAYGYGYPYYGFRPHFGFFPFGGFFGFILFIFLFFGLMRLIFFRRWAWGYGHMHRPRRGHVKMKKVMLRQIPKRKISNLIVRNGSGGSSTAA